MVGFLKKILLNFIRHINHLFRIIHSTGKIRNFTKFINTVHLEKCRHAG
jgi:hypothetical protein